MREMKKIRKQIGSLLLSVCMVVTVLPTVAFAEEGVQDSGTSSSISEITAFADLAEDVALQEVETGTTLEELNLPSTLTVTVTTVTTGSAMTATVSGDELATDSEAQETETREETTIDVSNWAADPDYDGDTAGDYTFTPTLTIPEGTTLANSVTAPQITVTVKETAVPILRGAEMQLLGTGTSTDITDKFTDDNFLAAVYAKIGKTAPAAIYDTDVSGITSLDVSHKSIKSLAGIEYFIGLTELNCALNHLPELDVSNNTALINLYCSSNYLTALDVSKNSEINVLDCGLNKLTALDVSSNTALTILYCYDNRLTTLNVSNNTELSGLRCYNNYMTDESAVKGLNKSLTAIVFEPQSIAYSITVNSGTASLSTAWKNTSITITANTAPSGQWFKEWMVVSGDVMLASNTSATTTFTMPSNDVEVTATYEDIPTGVTDITDKFTDANFLARVYSKIGKTAPEPIYNTDVSGIASLDVGGKSITSLAGIEYFTKLTTLQCSVNQLTELDVSKNTLLTELNCFRNELTTLDVSKNTELTKLNCSVNTLTSLDVSNTKLTMLDCSLNRIRALDVSKNSALTMLYCSNNYMTSKSAVKGLDESLTTITFNPQLTTYSVTVNSGTASLSTAAEGATVTITADTAPSGKQFKEWTVVSGRVTLANAQASSTTFTMPANAVEVTATYEDIPVGVSVSTAAELKAALEETTSQIINVTADFTFTEKITQGADHTLVIESGKTVTASGSGFIDIGSHTLIMNGGGTFVSNRNGNALFSTNGTLNLENIIVNLTGNGGIVVKTTNIDNGATVNLNSSEGDQLIRLSAGYTLNINTGGAVEITNFNGVGIFNYGGALNINGGSLTVGKGQSDDQTGIYIVNSGLLKYSSGTLNATNNVVICFDEGTFAKGVNGRFIDGGYTLAASGKITIGAEDAAPSADGLTAGYYQWNSSKNAFEKQRITIEEQPQNVTVTEGAIMGSLSVTASASNAGTISYQWIGDGKDISGAVDATYILPMDLTAGTYEYHCELTTPGCMETYTRAATVTVNPAGGASTYAVTVNNGTASLSTAEAGANVTITADTVPSGKRFKEWTVVSGGAALANKKASSTTFTMPANAVEVTATYEDIPAGVTSVTGVTLNKNNLSLYSNTTPNTATLIATVAPASATDKSVTWQSSNTAVATVDASGNVTAVGNGTATITVTTTDGGYTASCTVTVSTYSSGGSSSGGSSSGGSSSSGSNSTTTTTTPKNKPNQPVAAAAPITATAGTNGAASASIPDQSISNAIAKAQTDAKAQGKTTNGVSVALNVTMPKGATALTATLTRSSLNSLVSAGVTNFEINGSPVTVTFDQKALTQIQKKSSGNINITIVPKTNLSETAKKTIGSRPVYNITVGYGNNSTVSSFGEGVATVAIPYTPANGEAIGGVYAVYVDEKGNATRIAGSTYDANSGCVIFTTPHFSMYGIGYTAPSAQFTDISSHWAKESIDYVVGRGLLSGATKTTFAPDTAMTRGMLVTALGRLAEVDTKTYTTSSFTDVNADSAYRPYIEWAYKKGMIQGIGSNHFAPDRAITREEIAVIIANFAKATGYTLPVTREATTYVDASIIGSTYKTAVTAMQQAGIMMGETNNKFNAKSNATRAEVSSMLRRYIKLTIDPNTAQGWVLNDAGQYLYYKGSKVLIGTQTIDDVKYVFNSNGVLQTGWVKDGGDDWRFYSGKTMLVGWWDLGANGNKKTYYFAKDGLMVSGKWLELDGKWHYFNTDGSLARSTKIDGYEVDENGVRKTK